MTRKSSQVAPWPSGQQASSPAPFREAIHTEHADETREIGIEEEDPGEQYDAEVEEDEDPGDEYDGGDDPSPYSQDDEEHYSESDEAGRRHPDAW